MGGRSVVSAYHYSAVWRAFPNAKECVLPGGTAAWSERTAGIFRARQPITQHVDDRDQTSTAVNGRTCVAMQPCRAEPRDGGKLPLDQQIKPDTHGMRAAGRETPLVAQSLAIRGKI